MAMALCYVTLTFFLQVEYELAMKAVRDGRRVLSLVLLKENQKFNEVTTLR